MGFSIKLRLSVVLPIDLCLSVISNDIKSLGKDKFSNSNDQVDGLSIV